MTSAIVVELIAVATHARDLVRSIRRVLRKTKQGFWTEDFAKTGIE